MHNELISLIIPAYNVDKYIGRCIESVIAQTYGNWELIIVNDGSCDDTEEIVRKYGLHDKRIKLYNKKNQGVCESRNYGISVAEGDWFGFVDADDWLEPIFLEVLYNNAIENDCTISACRFLVDYGDAVVSTNDIKNDVKLFSSANDCIHNFICDGLSMEGMVWNKIYRADIYKTFRFDSGIRVNEDCKYTFELMCNCNHACLTSAKLYHWFHRSDSASRGNPTTIELDNARVFLDLIEKTKNNGDDEVNCKLKAEYVYIVMKMLTHVKYTYDNSQLVETRERLINWRKEVWPLLNDNYKRYYDIVVYYPRIMNLIRIKNKILENLKTKIKMCLFSKNG